MAKGVEVALEELPTPGMVRSADFMERINAGIAGSQPVQVFLPPGPLRTGLAIAGKTLWPQNDIDLVISLALMMFGGPLGKIAKVGGKMVLARLLESPIGRKLATDTLERAAVAAERVGGPRIGQAVRQALEGGGREVAAAAERGGLPAAAAERGGLSAAAAERGELPAAAAERGELSATEAAATWEKGTAGQVARPGAAIEEGQLVEPEIPFPGKVPISPLARSYGHPYLAGAGRLLKRAAVPVTGGVIGAAVSDRPLSEGAESGTAAALGMELFSVLAGTGRRGVERNDVERIAAYLKRKFPNVAFPEIHSVAELRNVLRARLPRAAADASDMMRGYIGQNLRRRGLRPIRLPTIAAMGNDAAASEVLRHYDLRQLDFNSVDKIVTALQDEAHRLAGAPRDTMGARRLNGYARKLRGELENWLNEKVSPELGGLYRRVRSQYAIAHALQDIARKADVTETGKLSMRGYQQMAARARMATELPGLEEGLTYRLGDTELRELQDVMSRGAAPGALDKPATWPFTRLYARPGEPESLHFGFHLPTPARHVGQVPAFLGRGPWSNYLGSRVGLGPLDLSGGVEGGP